MLQAILSDCETTTDAINLAVRWKDPVILRTQLEESDAVDPRGLARALTNALLGNEPEVVRALIQYNVTPQHVLLRTLMKHGKGVQSASLEHAWGELYEWTPKSYDDLSAQFGRGSFYRRLGQLMAPKTMAPLLRKDRNAKAATKGRATEGEGGGEGEGMLMFTEKLPSFLQDYYKIWNKARKRWSEGEIDSIATYSVDRDMVHWVHKRAEKYPKEGWKAEASDSFAEIQEKNEPLRNKLEKEYRECKLKIQEQLPKPYAVKTTWADITLWAVLSGAEYIELAQCVWAKTEVSLSATLTPTSHPPQPSPPPLTPTTLTPNPLQLTAGAPAHRDLGGAPVALAIARQGFESFEERRMAGISPHI